jgi:hypothetical protein
MIHSPVKFAAVLAAAAVVGASTPAPAAPVRSHAPIQAVAAKTCPAGFTQARTDGRIKCLHVGEFCRHADDRQYRHYGFRCIRYYRNVHRYRLTRA